MGNNRNFGGIIYKKFLLITIIGLVLAISVYGGVKEIMAKEIKKVDHISNTSAIVYVE